jgi:hypothetical protein
LASTLPAGAENTRLTLQRTPPSVLRATKMLLGVSLE